MIAYKFRSGRGPKDCEGNEIFTRDITLLSQDSIYLPTVEQLNDPAEALVDDRSFKALLKLLAPFTPKEARAQVEDSLQSLYDKIRSTGIYSLSKDVENELMWAYYTNGHNGYAIIYDTKVLANSFNCGKWSGMYEVPVVYSGRLPLFDITKIDDYQAVLTCLVGTKSKAWEHEKEHRLVFDHGGRTLKIDYRAVKGFVFGCRMGDADIDYVMKSFSGRGLNYYKIELKDNSYKLVKTKLPDKYLTEEKYRPNAVKYDLRELLKGDAFIGGAGNKYQVFVKAALDDVSREPFVTSISHIVVSDDKRWPHILIWTRVDQEGVFRPMRAFEYDIIDEKLVKSREYNKR